MRILHRYKKNPCNVQYSIDSGGIEYGLLYNWYAATDARNIANTGFHIATYDDVSTLIDFINSPGDDGGKLKETGFSYWDSPNTGATNEYGFNWRGSGGRGDDGSFWDLKAACYLWNIGESDSRFTFETSSFESVASNNERYQSYELVRGASLRVVKDSTTLSHGETGTYTGNDGKIYPTICIGTQEWVAANLAETEYRNGDTIPEVTDNTTWAGLITGALCAFNNDWNYVGTTPEPDTINYTLISGELPITVELIGNTTHTNNHIILESGSFTDIPGGTYTFKVTDALGCEESEIIEIPYSEPIALNSSYDIDRKTLETCTVFKGFDYTVFGFTGETMFDRVKITSVPTNGTLSRGLLDTILVNDELIYPSDFNNGLYYRTSSIEKVDYSDTIGFQVRVNGLWSNTATITINVNSCIFADDCIEYGYLYNWYAVSDVRNIANTGWHAMTWDDMMNLLNYVTGGNYDYSDMFDFFNESYNGGELKDTGIDQWEDPNLYATNEYGFNAVGSGIRFFDGSFLGINEVFTVYTSDKQIVQSKLYSGEFDITNSSMFGYLFTYGFNEDSEHTLGRSSRLVSDVPATGLTDGTTGTYTGNDGKIYSTVVINEKWWLAENLAETQYRNGDPIPTVEDNATWAGLTTGAKCAYDNNYEYVGCDETGDGCLSALTGNGTISVSTWDFSSFTGRPVVTIEKRSYMLRLSVFDEGNDYELKYGYVQNTNWLSGTSISTPYGDVTAKIDFAVENQGIEYLKVETTFDGGYILYDVNHGFNLWTDLGFDPLTYSSNGQQDYQLAILGYDRSSGDYDGTAKLTDYNARQSSQLGYTESYAGVSPYQNTFTNKIGDNTGRIWFTNGDIMFNHKLNGIASPTNWSVTSSGSASGFFWFGRTTRGAATGYKYWTMGDDFYVVDSRISVSSSEPTSGTTAVINTLGFTITFSGTWAGDEDNLGLYYYNHTTNTLYKVALGNAMTTPENYIDNGCVPSE